VNEIIFYDVSPVLAQMVRKPNFDVWFRNISRREGVNFGFLKRNYQTKSSHQPGTRFWEQHAVREVSLDTYAFSFLAWRLPKKKPGKYFIVQLGCRRLHTSIVGRKMAEDGCAQGQHYSQYLIWFEWFLFSPRTNTH
jgi:hypothetical protein